MNTLLCTSKFSQSVADCILAETQVNLFCWDTLIRPDFLFCKDILQVCLQERVSCPKGLASLHMAKSIFAATTDLIESCCCCLHWLMHSADIKMIVHQA